MYIQVYFSELVVIIYERIGGDQTSHFAPEDLEVLRPPDLPSLLLDARICFLGMPIRNSNVFLFYFF